MADFSGWILPAAICLIIAWGFIKGVPVFDRFLEGAKEGLQTAVSILPPLVGLLLGVTMLSASGALDMLCAFISPAAEWMGLPPETMPLALLRPISGSGSLAILSDIFVRNGPDSFAGRVASVMMGSTETTFYAIAVYFGSVGIKKTRHAVPSALTADLVGYFMSAAAVRMFFAG